MDSNEEYLYHLKRLITLVEEENVKALNCLGGEMLDQYIKMIKIDKDELEQIRKTLYK